MSLPPKNTGDELAATEYNIVQALAEGAMRGTNNLSEISNPALARTALALAAVAASGAYADLSGLLVDSTDGNTGKALFRDPAGRVIAKLGAGGLEIGGVTIAPTGTTTIPTLASDAATVADLTATEALLATLGISSGDGGDGVIYRDAGGRRLFAIRARGTDLGNVRISSGDGAGGIVFLDKASRVIARISATGQASGFGGASTTTWTAAEIEAAHNGNVAAVAALAAVPTTNLARAIWYYCHFIIYGQSLSIASEGVPVISTAAVSGTKMYGDKIRPTTNNSATATWDRVGSSAFNDMVTTGDAEVPIAGALRFLRRLWLDWRGVASDSTINFVGSSTGIGGQSIAALSKGASPEIYARVTSCISQALAQATGESKTYGVPAILWMQGEANQSTDTATYKAALLQLVNDLCTDVVAGTGQARPPGFFTYQTSANPNNDTNNGGTVQAQLELALEDPRVTMVGPIYQVPDSSNLHLVANPYRWVGAYFAKAMHRVLNQGQRFLPLHMRSARRRGREILIDFHVPVPPLVFEDPWLQGGFSGSYGGSPLAQTNTQYAAPNKGFVVRNMTTSTNLTISSVAFASDTSVLVTLSAEPSASDTLAVRYASGVTYGHGCVRDSDPTTADDAWEHVSGRTDADTNAALLGAPYPLPNWAVAQHIEVT